MLDWIVGEFAPPPRVHSAARLLARHLAGLPPLTWTVRAGHRSRGPVMAVRLTSEAQRIAVTGQMLAALDGCDGATVDVTTYAGGRPVATRSRVWTGGRWQTVQAERDMTRENDGEVCDG